VLKIRLSLVGSRVSVHEIDANNLGAPAQVRSAWPQQNSPLIWFIVVFDLRRILLPCFFLGRHIRGRFSDNSACFCFVEWAETIGLNFCKNKWSHNRLTLGIFSYQANIPTKHRYQCPSDEPQAFSYLLFFLSAILHSLLITKFILFYFIHRQSWIPFPNWRYISPWQQGNSMYLCTQVNIPSKTTDSHGTPHLIRSKVPGPPPNLSGIASSPCANSYRPIMQSFPSMSPSFSKSHGLPPVPCW
jgi:hypothetical protein